MPTGRMVYGHTSPTAALLLNGQILIAGGDIGDGGDGATTRVELYDPTLGAFAATGNLNVGREQNATVLLPDGTVLAAGGHGGVPVTGGGFDNLASAEIYNPVTGRFSSTGSMTTGRDWLDATLLNDGRVLITGGNEYYPCCAGGRDPSHRVSRGQRDSSTGGHRRARGRGAVLRKSARIYRSQPDQRPCPERHRFRNCGRALELRRPPEQ